MVRRGRYDACHGRAFCRGREDPDPALDSARRPPDPAPAAVGDRGRGPSRRLPVPRRGADRVPAQPDRADADAGLDPSRLRHRARVPQLRRHPPCGDPRARHRRRRPDEVGANRVDTYFTVAHGQPRPDATPTATSTASSTGSTRTGSARSRSRSTATTSSRRSARRTSPSTRATSIDFVEGAAISDQVPLRARAGDRRLDLHAARLAAAGARRRPALPAASGLGPAAARGSSTRSPATSRGSCCSR